MNERIELPKGVAVRGTYSRGGVTPPIPVSLPDGRYVREWTHEGLSRLAAADWNEHGYVTFHSNKHIYLVREELLTPYIVSEV